MIEWVNAGFPRLTGRAPGEVAGRTPGSVPLGPDTDSVVDASMRDARCDILRGAGTLRVCDRGVGIPPGEIGKIFTRFFRASTAKGIAGTGIGLHLVRELVAMHHGTIDVSSELGRGTCFEVQFPVDREAIETQPTSRADARS